MRYDEKAEKKFESRIPLMLDLGKKIPKNIVKKFKKLKYLFPALFLAKTGWDRLKKRKKNLFANSVQTWPRQENSEKNKKKIEKIKIPLSGFISSQNGMR